VDRIGRVAETVFSDHPLTALYVRMFFRQCIAAVKSLSNYLSGGNGLQISGVLILEGRQFIGKSTWLEKLVPSGFLSAAGGGLQLGTNKETDSKRECLSGLVAVLNEIGASISRSEAEALKNFLTQTFDEFRTAYAHYPISKPRMTVFVGTSNDLVLKDPTGSRRYWAMHVSGFDFEKLEAIDLQQVYAQAWHEVMIEGGQWWLEEDQDRVRARENARHQLETEEAEALNSYLNTVGERHEDRWLSRTQIMNLIGVRARFPNMIKAFGQLLEAEEFEYRSKVKGKLGQEMRNVYRFPILPEKYKLLTN
jgi:predicted P-loop ATPase